MKPRTLLVPRVDGRDGVFRCPICRAEALHYQGKNQKRPKELNKLYKKRFDSLESVRRHLKRYHSDDGNVSYEIGDTPNRYGRYSLKITARCGCGCGAYLVYTSWMPVHGPPYYRSGHLSRIVDNGGRFEKGHVPWTKGLAGKGVCKPNKGSFKKGHKPASDRGGIYNLDGYIYLWTGEFQPSGGRKYFARSRLVLEEKLGRKLSKSEVVIHKDGDRQNDDPENLEIISRAEHATRNRWKGHKATEKKKKPKREKTERKPGRPKKNNKKKLVAVQDIPELVTTTEPVKSGLLFCPHCGAAMPAGGGSCRRCNL